MLIIMRIFFFNLFRCSLLDLWFSFFLLAFGCVLIWNAATENSDGVVSFIYLLVCT